MKCPGSPFMSLVLKFILSDLIIATLAVFSCPFAWNFFSNQSLLFCIGIFVWGGSLVGSICAGHVFLSIQLPCVFWLEHLLHLHLRLLLTGTFSLSFYPFCTFVPVSLTLFLHLIIAVPLAYLAMLLWWRCIFLAFFCVGNSLFHLPF